MSRVEVKLFGLVAISASRQDKLNPNDYGPSAAKNLPPPFNLSGGGQPHCRPLKMPQKKVDGLSSHLKI